VEPLQIVCGASECCRRLVRPDRADRRSAARRADPQKIQAAWRRIAGDVVFGQGTGAGGKFRRLLPLPANSRPGQNVRELLALDDAIIEIELTPNRGDCLGMEGIAREVAALNRCEFRPLPTDAVPAVLDDVFPVTLLDPADGPRYVGRVIRGVDPAAETPLWMKERCAGPACAAWGRWWT
jgi:phenylalanyl-tRNA synthetase beta chain